MNDVQKITRIKTILGPDAPEDDVLLEYLKMTEAEILNWLYIRKGSVPEGAQIPAVWENVTTMAVIAGVNIMGAEGESLHIENGTHRQFKYDDMLAYVRAHVQPYVWSV